MSRRRVIAALVAVAALAVAVAVPALAATKPVSVGPQKKFLPGSLSIKKGDTVRFRWTGNLPHNVRIASGPQKGQIASARKSGTVSRRFTKAGTYRIVCDIHPGMTLRLRVS
jgi:plastocyanin